MSSEEQPDQQQQPVEEQEQPPQTSYPESRQADTWNKDVGETGRWGTRSRKELWIVFVVLVVVIAATVTGIVIGISDSDSDSENMNNNLNSNDTTFTPSEGGETTDGDGLTKIDPETGKRISAYVFPAAPIRSILTDQQELEWLRDQLAADSNMAPFLASLPAQVSAYSILQAEDETLDPVVRAAAWLVTVDPVNTKEWAVTRFALAAIYYTTGGEAWTNSAEWFGEKSHCEWYGVTCCQEIHSSLRCDSTSFDGVVELDLYNNNLAGPIPVTIGLLQELQSLFMSENAMTGSIPGAVFASMPVFAKLYLQHNQLTGTIPVEVDTNGIFDTIFVQGNNMNGTFPPELCPTCIACSGKLVHFGVDCDKIICTALCCKYWENCFYHDTLATK